MNMYRFRSLDKILGEYQELEKQEIYFSTLEELNDSMEGFMNIYWEGDEIAWLGLLKHYLLVLSDSFMLFRLGEEKKSLEDIEFFRNENDLTSQGYKDLYEDIKNDFFSSKAVEELIRVLSEGGRRVEKLEWRFFLSFVHRIAFATITKVHQKHNLFAKGEKKLSSLLIAEYDENFLEMLSRYDAIKENSKAQIALEISSRAYRGMSLNMIYKNRHLEDKEYLKKVLFLSTDFPSIYMNRIERLMFAESYFASFSSEPTIPLMWSHYAGGHKGICLKFKSKEKNLIRLGYANSNGSYQTSFRKIDYGQETPTVDFFRFLGGRKGDIEFILTDNGKRSKCYEPFLNEEKSRVDYWKKCEEVYTTKTSEWENENEYRLLITDFHRTKEQRTLKYDFADLEGIIFGVRTPTEKKLEIIEIISAKCKKETRTDFKFYEAEYSNDNRKMTIVEPFLLSREIAEEVKNSQGQGG